MDFCCQTLSVASLKALHEQMFITDGKANVLFNLLFYEKRISFENIYVFSKSLYQTKYEFLAKVLPKEIGFFSYDDNGLVIDPKEAKQNSILIFDDIACEKHDNIHNYFTMGRHNNFDTFYLGQTYSRILKQLIRDNTNFTTVFKQEKINLRHIYNNHVNTGLSFETFKTMCEKAWNNRYGFLVIHKDRDQEKGGYRLGFDTFVQKL